MIFIGLYKNGPLCTFKTGSGVTQIEFSPCGTKLFSAVRRNNEFLCWDLRNPGTILYSLQGRQSDTNQRIQFNLAPGGKHIVSGLLIQLLISLKYYNVNFVLFHIFLSCRWNKWRDCNLGISGMYRHRRS